MKKRKMRAHAIATALAIVCVCVLSGCGLFGCGKEDNTVYDVSSVEAFRAMEEGKNYRLTDDIDLGNAEWDKFVKLKSLDGDGHTVKNAFINRESEYYSAGFFRQVMDLKNITFENLQIYITVTNTKSSENSYVQETACGIVAGMIENAENVTVKNCTAEFTANAYSKLNRVGGLAGSNYANMTLKNCTVEDCSILATTNGSGIQIGGLIGVDGGGAAMIENCTTKRVTLDATASGGISAGGLIGEYGSTAANGVGVTGKGTIKSSVSTDCEINVQSGKGETLTRVGGFMGVSMATDAALENSAAIENIVTVETGYCYNVGGFAGRSTAAIRNCLSDGNTLTCSTSLAQDDKTEYVAGFCGSSQSSISRCIAQNNVVKGTEKAYSYMKAAGFIVSGTSVARSGVSNNTVTGGKVDAFACEADSVNVCGICIEQGTVTPSAFPLTLMLAEEWTNAIETLELDTNFWQFVDETLTLKFLAA